MSETTFNLRNYAVKVLLHEIAAGRIGLPEMQRPFVWEDAKIRDLFDSMYRGYPVGYLLLWDDGESENPRVIGTNDKDDEHPRLLVIDGQQRLSSLYAVMRAKAVVDKNYEKREVFIAFNPQTEEFAVRDKDIEENKAYMNDVSYVWNDNVNIFGTVDEYTEELSERRLKNGDGPIDEHLLKKIQDSVIKLKGLENYNFVTLVLNPDVPYEDICNTFTRINQNGVQLKEEDFILTSLSKYLPGARKSFDNFCRNVSQSDNCIISPTPAQLLTVSLCLAFGEVNLENVNRLFATNSEVDLEGKTVESRRQNSMLASLDDIQKSEVLNRNKWSLFLSSIRDAGFASPGRSNGTKDWLPLLYTIFLEAYREGIDPTTIRSGVGRLAYEAEILSAIAPQQAQRRFYSSLTFIARIKSNIRHELSGILRGRSRIWDWNLNKEFWSQALPSYLERASDPGCWNVFTAALRLLRAPAMFAEGELGDLLDAGTLEKHNLKPFLPSKKGRRRLSEVTDIAIGSIDPQAAVNFVHLPSEFRNFFPQNLPELRSSFTGIELSEMHLSNALPLNWETMNYDEFRANRSKLMASTIRDGHAVLLNAAANNSLDLSTIIANGESEIVEFKSTLRMDLSSGSPQRNIREAVLHTVAAFLNTDGGTLIVGLDDAGNPVIDQDGAKVGIEADQFESRDAIMLNFWNLVQDRINRTVSSYISCEFANYKGGLLLVVTCKPSRDLVFVKGRQGQALRCFHRAGPSTRELPPEKIQDYVDSRGI